MTQIRIHSCHRQCRTIDILKLIRGATGMDFADGKAVVDELYYGSGAVVVSIPAGADIEKLLNEIRLCKTEVEIIDANFPE